MKIVKLQISADLSVTASDSDEQEHQDENDSIAVRQDCFNDFAYLDGDSWCTSLTLFALSYFGNGYRWLVSIVPLDHSSTSVMHFLCCFISSLYGFINFI